MLNNLLNSYPQNAQPRNALQDPSLTQFDYVKSPIEQGLLPGQKTLDEQTQGLISERLKRGAAPIEEQAKQFTQGVDESGRQFASAGKQLNETQRALGGPQNEALGQVLEKRSNREYGQTLRDLQRQAEYDAQKKRADEYSAAGSSLSRYEQIKNTIFAQKQAAQQNLKEAEDAQKAEQGQILGSILGIIGGVVGGIYGGPGGAAAGSAAGGAVGNEIGKAI